MQKDLFPTVFTEMKRGEMQYRCLATPTNKEITFGGIWEFLYKDCWHEVKNRQLKTELNAIAGFIDINKTHNIFNR